MRDQDQVRAEDGEDPDQGVLAPERDRLPRDVRHRVPPQPGATVRGKLLEGLQDQLQGEELQLHPQVFELFIHIFLGKRVRDEGKICRTCMTPLVKKCDEEPTYGSYRQPQQR